MFFQFSAPQAAEAVLRGFAGSFEAGNIVTRRGPNKFGWSSFESPEPLPFN